VAPAEEAVAAGAEALAEVARAEVEVAVREEVAAEAAGLRGRR
jgi:hypothetical protein